MATMPPTAPVTMPRTLALPYLIHSATIHATAAAAVAAWVTSMAMPAAPSAARAEPALKPNQPTHSMEAPMTVITRLWGGDEGVRVAPPPADDHRRPRGAATPALMWTTVPPAKSMMPRSQKKAPSPLQVMWQIGA